MPFIRMADLQVLAKDNKGARESLQKASSLHADLYEAQRKLSPWSSILDAAPAAIAVARDVQKRQPKESAGYESGGRHLHAEKSLGRCRRLAIATD
jgi:hypothetical protein